MNPPLSTSPRILRIAAILAAVAAVSGALTLVGWATDIRRLADWDRDDIAQMPNNAVAVIATGAGIICALLGKRWLARLFGGAAALVALATLFEHLTGIDLGIDTLILHRDWGQRGTVAPGRMGFPGSIAISILGTSIIFRTSPRTHRWATVGGLFTMAIATLSLIGYVFSADPLYTIPRFTTIALQTSTMLLILGAALVASVPDRPPMRLLLGDSAAALLVRRAIPGAIILPVIIGWLGVRGQVLGYYDTAFGTAILVLTLITLLVALLWWAAADISAHERAMRENRDRLAAILGSITDAFVTVDANWTIGFANEQAEAFLQRRGPALLGASLWDIVPPATVGVLYEPLRQAMSERKVVQFETYNPVWNRWYANHAYPTADGGLSIYARDVTEQKHAEQAIRDSEQKFSLLFEKAAFGAALSSLPDGILIDVNESFTRLFGLTREETLGRRARELGISPDEGAAARMAEQLRREETVRDIELKMRTRANGERTFLVNVTTIELRGSKYRLTTLQDITERKAAEEALVRSAEALVAADRMKDEFLATLSHELRTPLTAIVGWSQLLLNAVLDEREQQTALEAIRASAKSQAQLIDDILDVSRIITGKMRLRREESDLVAVIEAAAATVRPAAEAKGIALRLTLDRSVPRLLLDPERMRQVVWNLLSNSIKFSTQGTVEVVLRTDEQSCILEVSDRGRGISADFLPHVFERFRQADSSPSRPHEGLGLGLALTKDLVELHGGTVSAESELGVGSRFTVRLPLHNAHRGEAAAGQADESPAAIMLDGVRVLYVDDRHDARLLVSTMLKQYGADVVEAGSVDEALRALASDTPHVVVTDLAMPGRDGYELLATIRSDHRWERLPVLALTAEGRIGDQGRAATAGFRELIRKPIESQDLAAAVAKAMNAGR